MFLCPLIFFHELGHFLIAKLCKVRVLVFSLGFGPKLLSIIRNKTCYAISLIPLGGYVKMQGDDPFNLEHRNDPEAYVSKKWWQKLSIVMAGPIANFIFALFLYSFLTFKGEKVPLFKIGQVPISSALYQAGMRSGDILVQLNNQKIHGLEDLGLVGDNINKAVVKRDNLMIEIPIEYSIKQFMGEVASFVPDTIAKMASVDGKEYFLSLSKDFNGLGLNTEFLKNKNSSEIYLVQVNHEKNIVILPLNKNEDCLSQLQAKGFFLSELKIVEVKKESAASKSGIQNGDIIKSLNGITLTSFFQMREILQKSAGAIQVLLLRNGKEISLFIKPDESIVENIKVRTLGVMTDLIQFPTQFEVQKSANWVSGVTLAIRRTMGNIWLTGKGILDLFSRKNALEMVGGPIAIAKAASDSFKLSIDQFLRLMAIISINLGVINLLPVPVLDGGHVVIILTEAISRRKISLKVLEWAYRIGFSLLAMLIVVALFNDLTR